MIRTIPTRDILPFHPDTIKKKFLRISILPEVADSAIMILRGRV
jgi:hypothetical protein